MDESFHLMRAQEWVKRMNENAWPGKKVLIVGMARSGIAAAELFCREGALVTVNDLKKEEDFGDKLNELKKLPIIFKLGQDGVDALKQKDLLVMSPGVPPDVPVAKAAREMGIKVTGELEMASRALKSELLAVTGTNGKTTTVSLLGAMFEKAGRKCFVAGNVGYPLSAAAMESRFEDVTVAEVSSFQLETTEQFHPLTAAVLNVTEDHLNRHGTMENYVALKRHIFDQQTEKDYAVLNGDDPICRQMAKGLKARTLFFSRLTEPEEGALVRDGQIVLRLNGQEETICRPEEIYIPGPHNLENALAASLIAFTRGVPAEAIAHALKSFQGVEHRIEFVRELDSVRYINDSKGTNVDSTIKAVQSMLRPTVMILGGYDKHVSFEPLSEEIQKSAMIRHCVLIGATADQIEESLRKAGYAAIQRAETLEEAVEKSRALCEKGGNVLFSPACASFDMFSDYEQRGRIFKSIVLALK